MKILKTLISSLIFILIFSIQANGQNQECASDLIHKQLLQSNPDYFNKSQQLENEIREIINNHRNRLNPNEVYTIPVVVHVIHLGEPIGTGTNISDAQIIGAIAGLNERWNNTYGGAHDYGVDIQVQFCLASRDPNGNPTTGINRVDASTIPSYVAYGMNTSTTNPNCNGSSETTIKDLSKWPVGSYYNIWVVNIICPNGVVGFARFPNGNAYDGITMKYSHMIYESHVLAHEMGHGFNLYHTFEGSGSTNCPVETDCSVNGDHVCDTPPQKGGDCGTTNSCSATGDWTNSIYNIMSYCVNRLKFTQGQKDRIRATSIVAPRLSLLSSLGCTTALGINDNELDKFIIFPNPADDKITIQLTNNINNGKFEIFNLIGEKMIEQNVTNSKIEINVNSFPIGVYLVKYSNSDFIITNKLIVD